MAMTVKTMYERLKSLIERNEREGRPEANNNEFWVSVRVSPRRKVYYPIEAVWGGTLTIPKPDNNAAGYVDNPRCVEARADVRDKVTVKA